jgi:hypothetical protein
MGQNPDRAPTRQKSSEGLIVAPSGRLEVKLDVANSRLLFTDSKL